MQMQAWLAQQQAQQAQQAEPSGPEPCHYKRCWFRAHSRGEHDGWCCGRCRDREGEGHRALHGPLCEKICFVPADVAAGTDPMEHTIAPVPGTIMMFGLRRNRCPDEKADVVAVVVVVEVL